MTATKQIEALPKIVRFFEPSRSAPGEAECPHCGARGAVIHRFQTEDGRRLGAMSGCVKLFPVSQVASFDLDLRKREDEYTKRGRSLASWDLKIRDIIDAHYNGEVTEACAIDLIVSEKRRAASFRRGRR